MGRIRGEGEMKGAWWEEAPWEEEAQGEEEKGIELLEDGRPREDKELGVELIQPRKNILIKIIFDHDK